MFAMQVVVVLGAVLGTIIYRISVVTVIYSSGEQFLKEHAKIFTSITAAVINLVIIMILTKASSGCRRERERERERERVRERESERE
jgi:NADH:ubiquinone oxidoreductase subunit 6 (subunit J)